MKKYLSAALALTLLCSALALTACGDDTAVTTAPKSKNTSAPKASNSVTTTNPDQNAGQTDKEPAVTTDVKLPEGGSDDPFQAQFRLYEPIENLTQYQTNHVNLTKEYFKGIVMNQSIFSGNDWTEHEGDEFEGLGKEDAPNLFDCNPETKWCCGRDLVEFKSAIVWEMNEEVNVTGYSLTTGNDNDEWPDRNPVQWRLYACNTLPEITVTQTVEGTNVTYLEDGQVPEGWTLLDAVDASLPDDTTQSMLPDAQFTEVGLELPEAGTYKYFMLIIDYTEQNDVTFQLADFTLYGTVAE